MKKGLLKMLLAAGIFLASSGIVFARVDIGKVIRIEGPYDDGAYEVVVNVPGLGEDVWRITPDNSIDHSYTYYNTNMLNLLEFARDHRDSYNVLLECVYESSGRQKHIIFAQLLPDVSSLRSKISRLEVRVLLLEALVRRH